MMRFLPCFVASALSVGACSSQVDSSYKGEPLFSVEGRVVASSIAAMPEADAAIAWIPVQYVGRTAANAPMPALVAARVPVTASFPASFRFDALEPPPFGAQQPVEGREVFDHVVGEDGWEPRGYSFGVLVALPRSFTGSAIAPSDVLGVDRRHLLLWLDRDAAEGDALRELARTWGVPPTRGYHLLTTSPEARARRNACRDGDVCFRPLREPCGGTTYLDGLVSYRYEQCIARSTSACTIVPAVSCDGEPLALTASEREESDRCLERFEREDEAVRDARLAGCESAHTAELAALKPSPFEIELGQPFVAATD